MTAVITPRAELPREPARLNLLFVCTRVTPHLLVALGVVIAACFAHELGHALAAQFFGARIVMFNVLGMQWIPKIEWMPQFGYGGYVYWFAPVNLTNHRLILMAGSTFTLLLALGAVATLNLFPHRGFTRTALIVMSLYFIDSLVKIFPALGWVPFGWSSRFTRSFSEAYFAAVALGIPNFVYIGGVVLLSVLITFFLVRVLRK